jgi:hypothetical protein
MTRCGSGNAHNVVVNASPAGARPDDSSPIDVPHLPVTTLAGEVVSKPPLTPLSGWPACATRQADARPRIPDSDVSFWIRRCERARSATTCARNIVEIACRGVANAWSAMLQVGASR